MSNLPLPTNSIPGSPEGPLSKKRVLSDIQNMTDSKHLQEKRRHSLGFDMAKIKVTSPIQNDNNFKSHIPRPQTNHSFELKTIAERNRKSSNIPVPVSGVSTSSTSGLNIQHMDRLIRLKQTLSKKPPSSTLNPEPSLRSRLNKVEQSFTRDLARQTEINYDLDSQLKELSSKSDDLEHELIELKRSSKKFHHRLSDLKIQINSSKKKFEIMEDSVMKNVLHKEQLVNIQIQELSNQLNDQYNEINFQLQDELQKARSYKDSAIADDLKELNLRIETLNNQLEETKLRKQQTLKSESCDLENELDKYLKSKSDEINKLTNTYETKQDELNEEHKTLAMIQNQVKSKIDENNVLQDSINTLESNINNFTNVKGSLLAELENSESELRVTEEENMNWDTKLYKTKSKYLEACNKTKKHIQQKRILGNSIMDYEGKLRVYVKAPLVLNSQELQYQEKLFRFNKVFAISNSNDQLIEDFLCLINNSLTGSNISIIFTGDAEKDLVIDSVIKSYGSLIEKLKNKLTWDFKFNLKCISIEESCKDLLNSIHSIESRTFSNSLSQLNSQKMIIDDSNMLSKTLNRTINSANASLFILNIDASNSKSLMNFETNVMFLDLASERLSKQKDYLEDFRKNNSNKFIPRLLNYAYYQSKCLFIANLKNDSDQNKDLLNLLEIINSTDSPYKRKN